MASLANQTISSTYDGLIKTSTDQPVGVSGVQLLEDGVGNSLALSVGRANQGVTVTGTLTATSITGVLADGVTATTQTLGDNSTKVATTAYVDAQVTASDLDFAGDSGTGAVDLDSQTFTIAGTANEIETVASGQTITIGLPSSVTVGTLNATTLGGTLSTAAQPNITSVGTLSSLAVSGNLTVDTNTLYVDAVNNRVAVGTTNAQQKLHVQDAGAVSIRLNDSTTNYWDLTNDSNLIFSRGGTERMRITSDGSISLNAKGQFTNPFTSSWRQIFFGSNGTLISREADNFANLTLGNNYYIENQGGSPVNVRRTGATASAISFSGADILFSSDSSTGAAGDTLSLTEKMRIDSSGNVGIGTSSPTSLLTLKDNFSSGVAITLDRTQNAGVDNLFYTGVSTTGTTAGDYMWLGVATSHLSLTGSGNVGIGTSNPAYTLDISGASDNTTVAQFSTGDDVRKLQLIPYNQNKGGANPNAHWEWNVTSSVGSFSWATSAGERMRIDSSGNVGIGESSPSSFDVPNLVIEGSTLAGITISESTGAGIGKLNFAATASFDSKASISCSVAGGGDLRFDTNGSERMRITSGGALWVGTTSGFNYAGGISAKGYANKAGTSGGFSGNNFNIDWTGSANLYIDTTNLGAILTSSDYRIKRNIETQTAPALERISQLRPVSYQRADYGDLFKADDKIREGFIAHELAEIIPSAVEGEKDAENQIQSLKLDALCSVMVKAMQEQQEIINDLKARIETLETK